MPIKDARGRLLPLPRSLRVCTMSADFWGLPTAGGTATAYGLLTSALSEDTSLDVSARLHPAPRLSEVLYGVYMPLLGGSPSPACMALVILVSGSTDGAQCAPLCAKPWC